MTVETQTGQAKKKFVVAVKGDLEKVSEALGSAREILQALTQDAKGLDKGLVTACTGWGTHLDAMLQSVKDEGTAVAKRMGDSDNGRSKVMMTEIVDHSHTAAVVAARSEELCPECGSTGGTLDGV